MRWEIAIESTVVCCWMVGMGKFRLLGWLEDEAFRAES